ncbi:DnaJ C-terminal domain-containing protein [Azoarcus indigens]|uniref:Molecular chaperone DnaJ n=1 Tax=Azoarcus indigens TaxID=29545 RepID=A0A4R6EEJ0_9RHOO|nr:DnaJ C-terminal domain-containing protein [Azoarcus indigens]TDN56666.1 molecular chaperone DnaJ [Azoarcus indigens]
MSGSTDAGMDAPLNDPHELLGVAPGADASEIKRAFRRLAMRWHPDRNPDPAAADHFRRLRAAFESLLDGLQPAGPAAEPQQDTDAAPRGADLRETLEISLEEACLGGVRTLVREESTRCEDCQGSGEQTLRHSRLCPHCHGSGRVRGAEGLTACARCQGRGYRLLAPCDSCGGNGKQIRPRNLEVRLPPGLQPGDELRLRGEGGPAVESDGEAGDLRLRIEVAPHPLYRLAGRDLLLERPLSVFRLLAGGEIALPHPAGLRHHPLPPGDGRATELRLSGAGLPRRGKHAAGDMLVTLRPVLPTGVGAELLPLLDRLDRALASELTEISDWESRWLPA